MRVWGIMMVKDEADIIEENVRHHLKENLTGLYIADNGSTDGTFEKLLRLFKEFPDKVVVGIDQEPGYYQSQKMTRMMNYVAMSFGAEWILPIDADEFWYHQNGPLADVLSEESADIMYGRVWHMVSQVDEYNQSPLKMMVYRSANVEQMPVVAFKYHPDAIIAQGNHSVMHPGTISEDRFDVKHYQYRSLSQYKRKVRNGKNAYDSTNLPDGEGWHWRWQGALSDEEIYQEWCKMAEEKNLILDPYVGEL